MRIQNWSENIIIVDFSREPKMFDDLDVVTKTVREKRGHSVILDFSGIDIITAPGIARISSLHNLLTQHKRRLILCNISQKIKGIFTQKIQFADDKSAALASLETTD